MKKIMLFVFALVLIGSLVAQAEKVKLTLYDYLDLSDKVETKNREEMRDAFKKANPDIELEIEVGFSEAYHNKLQPMAVAGQLPDIMFLWPDKRTGYVTGNKLIKDISPLIKGHEAEFIPGSLDPQGPNGAIYELPEQMTATHVMYVNEKLLKDLGLTFPKTMDELIAQAAYGDDMTQFVQEKAVYWIDGGWRVNSLVGELKPEQKAYISLKTFPEIPNQKGQAGSTASVAGTGFGMNAKLEGAKADAAWKWIWFWSGPDGSKIRRKNGALPAYKLPAQEGLDPMILKLADFIANTPAGYVIDSKLDGEGMAVLHAGLQEMLMGTKTPAQVAKEYEDWVAKNDSNRKK
jgi:ABC-type glycerol-3-phosphate transport system substrate-binding protein